MHPESKYHMSHGISWMVLHSIWDVHAINIALDKLLCSSTGSGFSFLGHIASSCIHMHNDQICYNNDIEFFTYQTCDHLDDLGSDSFLY